mmetsp:Transcript_7033/g.21417  ORF Transcript_7033/g.21417 Transcript_7033/m.21417 type:complete len:209 (-) Transcript_7033:618-1244(-)
MARGAHTSGPRKSRIASIMRRNRILGFSSPFSPPLPRPTSERFTLSLQTPMRIRSCLSVMPNLPLPSLSAPASLSPAPFTMIFVERTNSTPCSASRRSNVMSALQAPGTPIRDAKLCSFERHLSTQRLPSRGRHCLSTLLVSSPSLASASRSPPESSSGSPMHRVIARGTLLSSPPTRTSAAAATSFSWLLAAAEASRTKKSASAAPE